MAESEPKLKWLEICVTADDEAAEAVVELFNRHGRGRAVVETPVDCFEHELGIVPLPTEVLVKTYLPLDGTTDEARRRLEEGLWHLRQIYPFAEPAFREMAEEDWAEAWKQHYHLQRVGQRLVIVPAWEEYAPAPGEVTIRLEPGMAFGTGLHPTTRLCLEALEKYVTSQSTLLDVGTGSGVLAIGAAKLGARRVDALDADPVAVSVAQENVRMNGVEAVVTVAHGSLRGGDAVPLNFATGGPVPTLDEGHFDLVAVNIVAPVIVGMAASLARRVRPGGRVIAAGLIEPQEADVRAALASHGLQVIERSQEKDWVGLVAHRE